MSLLRPIYSLVFCFLSSSIILVSCKTEEPATPSAYISHVFEYVYAPGQHSSLAQKSDASSFVGEPVSSKKWLYLGGFGGYVIAGFDHDIANHDGADLEIYALSGAMPEPAIVYVMTDENGDGKPNETWFELKGSQFENSKRNYSVCYYKAKNDTSNIRWKDSEGNRGELICGFGASNSSAWWWPEIKADSIIFTGTRLPDSYENNPVNGTQYWTVPKDKFVWGYAENNFGTDYEKLVGANKLDISNAVDSLGNSVSLSNIRFIKIQTGVFQQAGWTNEVSSEVRGAKELK